MSRVGYSRVITGWALVGLVASCAQLVAAEPLEIHAAFRAVVRPSLPDVRGAHRTDVDHFVLAALEAKGLALNPEADHRTLIRRVSFDLTGLPPSPAEIDAFLADQSPGAYERMLNRYLAS